MANHYPPHSHILVTGADGQVGWELMRRADGCRMQLLGGGRKELDITRAHIVHEEVLDTRPALVINCAAYTAVDKAEEEAEAAYAVNRDGVVNLAQACTVAGVPLIHLSTDYVFDGNKPAPYTEDDPTCPINVYGKSKEAGEREVRERLSRHVILRTSWVYGVHGSNFVKTMLRLGREREELRVVSDQQGCPTAAGDIADTVIALANRIVDDADGFPWGTYHYAGGGVTSWHGLAEAVFVLAAAHWDRRIKVTPLSTAEYPTPARRPMSSVLDCARIGAAFGLRPRPWRDALAEVVTELMTEGG